MAYNSYTNFINPVRQPSSSLFQMNGITPRRTYRPQTVDQVNQYNHSRIDKISIHSQKPPLVQPHHMKNNSQNYIPPHMLNNNKRLELIKEDKDKLYNTLRENERLEQELVNKAEIAIRQQQEREVTQIQSQIQILRKELDEKENLEKELNERKNQIKIEHERSELARIKNNKNYILEKIKNQETNIIKIREADELRRLEKEKEILTQKWKEVQLEEERRKQIELSERESALRLEQERVNLESLEMTRLKRETESLKDLLQHKSNQEELLSRRISHDRENELAAEKIRRMKMEERLKESEKLGGIVKTKFKKGLNETKSSHNSSIKKIFKTRQSLDDGYLSDAEGFGEVDNIFNEPIFMREKNSRQDLNNNRKSLVDPNEYDLDKIDYTESTVSKVNSKLKTKNINDLNLDNSTIVSDSIYRRGINNIRHSNEENISNVDTKNYVNHPKSIRTSDNLDYSTIMDKLKRDMESHYPKSKHHSEQLKIMLEACEMMSNIKKEAIREENELQDEIRDPSQPNVDIDLDVNLGARDNHIVPSQMNENDEELDSEIFEIHRQMSDIKGILKDS